MDYNNMVTFNDEGKYVRPIRTKQDYRPLDRAIKEKTESYHRFLFKNVSERLAESIRSDDKYFNNHQEIVDYVIDYIDNRMEWRIQFTNQFVDAVIPIMKKKVSRRHFFRDGGEDNHGKNKNKNKNKNKKGNEYQNLDELFFSK